MSELKNLAVDVQKALEELFSKTTIPSQVKDAMWYSVSAGGKRLRPALMLLFCRAFGGQDADAMPYACAMEMIHTYSLIHDDLPAMDNDDLRRGRPTCHKVYGEGMALLAGDGLLNFAYETMIAAAKQSPVRGIRAMDEIACGAGVTGMIAGQCMDLSNERGNADYPTEDVHRAKTGAMIRAACTAGAILGGADEDGVAAAACYGEKLGLAFQITDDILDVTGDEAKLGKPIGSDARNEKQTYVGLYGLQKARELACQVTSEAIEALSAIDGDTQVLSSIAQSMLEREA